MVGGLQRRRRRVILPRMGIASPAMASAALGRVGDRVFVAAIAKRSRAALAEARDEPAPDYPEASYEVLANAHADGGKLVLIGPDAEQAFKAAAPHLRLAPVRRYRFIGDMREETARPLGEAEEGLFLNDLRRQLYGALGPGPRGRGVLVAVLDTGVDRHHDRLNAAYAGGRGFIPGEPEDLHGEVAGGTGGGHGTHVAGIIAARGDPTTGPVGVANEACFKSYRIYARRNVRAGAPNYAIIAAIHSAVADDCHLINISFGGGEAHDDGVRDAVNHAWRKGVVCVAAAGNDGRRRVLFPAAHPNCVAVSAIGRVGCFPDEREWRDGVGERYSTVERETFIWKDSNWGAGIDFTAPGHAICSTLPNNRYGLMSGTSSSAPVVSALAAVLLSRSPGLLAAPATEARATGVMQLLAAHARTLAFGHPEYDGRGLIRP